MIGSSRFPWVIETGAEMEVEAKGRSGEGKASGKIRRGEEGDGRSGEGKASGKIRRVEEGDGRSGEGKAAGKLRRIDDKVGKSAKDEERMSKMEEEEEEEDEDDDEEEEEEPTVCKMEEAEMIYYRYPEQEEDEEQMLDYRRFWEVCWGGRYGSFEDITSVPAMRYTSGPIPASASVETTLQIFSVKVAEINEEEGLEWPLHVYGFVATRDNVDHNRDFMFRRDRDNCQILTQKDSFLQLSGPSRAVVLTDPVDFEVQLKVKGRTESEDKALSLQLIRYKYDRCSPVFGAPTLICECYPNKLSTLEYTFAQLHKSVEATIRSVKVVKGSWPCHFRGLVVSRTASIANEDILLFDSQHAGTMPINSDGVTFKLSRCVVSVELSGQLIVSVVALRVGNNITDDVVSKDEAYFKPQKAGKSCGMFKLGFCEVEIIVAWSLLGTLFPKLSW